MQLRGGQSTPFGSLTRIICGSRWADDSCMGHGLALLQRDNKYVGIIDPIFHCLKSIDEKLRHGCSENPFDIANNLALLALHADTNHWSAVGFDVCPESRLFWVFD